MHEDSASSGYARGAVDDDADSTPGHEWVGENPVNKIYFNDSLHRMDVVPLADKTPHSTGNMLNVAYLIMAAGGSTTLPSGKNPVCDRQPTWPGCEEANKVPQGGNMGPAKAGSLLFYALQFTVNASTTWWTVADRVNLAAFQRFSNCNVSPPNNAWPEQALVAKAFAGIGYPRTLPDIQCP